MIVIYVYVDRYTPVTPLQRLGVCAVRERAGRRRVPVAQLALELLPRGVHGALERARLGVDELTHRREQRRERVAERGRARGVGEPPGGDVSERSRRACAPRARRGTTRSPAHARCYRPPESCARTDFASTTQPAPRNPRTFC